MNTIEYLDAAMAATQSKTDYQLSKSLGLPNNRISDYRKHHRKPDEYACTRIAVALGIDPVIVIGEIAMEWEKRPERREWWNDFLRSAGRAGAIVTLALTFTLTSPHELQAGTADGEKTTHKEVLCAL